MFFNDLNKFKTNIFDKVFLLYILKCIIGASFCYWLYYFFPTHQFNWSIISVLLVLAPDKYDSNKLAFDRMKANLTGASVGLLSFLLYPPNIFSLIISIIVTILFCSFIKLGGPTRSALAALVIVLLEEKELTNWQAATDRMICVVTGCIVALVLTYIFHHNERNLTLDKS